jgi:hypothetical protein
MPGARVVIDVDPPIEAGEKPYIMTVRGKSSVLVQPIDTARIAITNPTKTISLFYFFVASQLNGERFPTLARILGGF